MLSEELLRILVCPQCKGELEYDRKNEKLICRPCGLKYDIRDNIPIMLVDEAEKL
ncbi:MAG: Trm112 family protein [Candidatus Eisenbacteria bacterium]|nr:Trm112 family protein [Candidatus Eisenbacteria bacterium]